MMAVQWQGEDLILRVHIQPRSSKDEVVGLHGDRLKIRISAPPVDGQANHCLVDFLSDLFDVPKNRVELMTGLSGREKSFRILRPNKLPDWVSLYAEKQ